MAIDPNPYEFTSKADVGTQDSQLNDLASGVVARGWYLLQFLVPCLAVVMLAWFVTCETYRSQPDRVKAYYQLPVLIACSKLGIAATAILVSLVLRRRTVWAIIFGVVGMLINIDGVVAISPKGITDAVEKNPFFGFQGGRRDFFCSATMLVLIPAFLECLFWKPAQTKPSMTNVNESQADPEKGSKNNRTP